MRPIAAAYDSPFNNISITASRYFRHGFKNSNIIIEDTRKLITELDELGKHLPPAGDVKLQITSADITNLYGEIPLDELITIIRNLQPDPTYINDMMLKFFNARTLDGIIKEATIQSLNTCYVEFNHQIYKQTKGIPMGYPYGPTLANLFLHTIIDEQINNHQNVLYYRRYLDDLLIVTNDLPAVIEFTSKLHNNLTFTFDDNMTSTNFLDLNITLNSSSNNIHTVDLKTYVKPNNKLLYIPLCSLHSNATKKGFIITELKRMIRCNNKQEYYKTAPENFFKALIARGYNQNFINKAVREVNYHNRSEYLKPRAKLSPKATILITHLDKYTADNTLQTLFKSIIYKEIQTHNDDTNTNNSDNIDVKIMFALRKSPTLRNIVIQNSAVNTLTHQ